MLPLAAALGVFLGSMAQVPLLNWAAQVYAAWAEARPEDAEGDLSFVPLPAPDNDLDTDDGHETLPRRCVLRGSRRYRNHLLPRV